MNYINAIVRAINAVLRLIGLIEEKKGRKHGH